MARPKRNKSKQQPTAATDEQKAPVAGEPSVEETPKPEISTPPSDGPFEPDDDDSLNTEDLSEIEKLQLALATEVAVTKRHEAEMAELREQLTAAEKQIQDEADAPNRDFDEKPPPGVYWYYEVTFHPKRTDGDQHYVEAGVNGKIMQWHRNQRTGLRSDYKEVIDNAFVPKFKQIPGEDRKQIGGLKPFTYLVHREIKKEEYDEMKKQGDEKMKQALVSGGN